MSEPVVDPKPELRTLGDALSKAFADIPREQWAPRLGYRGLKRQAEERVVRVLDDQWLGLADQAYDLRYNSVDFLKAMTEVAGLTDPAVEPLIERARQWLDAEQHAFKPYLFVDTAFRRTTEPVQVIAAAQHNRRLQFDEPGFWRLDQGEQLARAKARVRQHMEETGGELTVWGKNQCYRFHHSEDAVVTLSTDGQVVDP